MIQVKSYSEYVNALQAFRNNFSELKAKKIADIQEAIELLKLEFTKSEADIVSLSSQMVSVQRELEKAKLETCPETLKGKKVFLFEDSLYEMPADVRASRSRGSYVPKFSVGDVVRMEHNGIYSEIYTVVEGNRVKNADGTLLFPSRLTELFHTEQLGLTPSAKGMAGLSHNYWKLAPIIPESELLS
jgi:hypothetical protein